MTLTVVGEQNNPLTDYLGFIYGGNTGIAYTAVKRPDGTFTQNFFAWPDNAALLQDHILANAGYGEVYIAPALFKAESALKENVAGSQVVWCEFDGNAPSVEGLPDGIPSPSLRIQSSESGHEHWYWKLTEFTSDLDSIERINRALSYHLGADASGWDVNQILRPPTTFNHKRNKPVGILYTSEDVYGPETFVSWEAPARLNEQLINEVIPDAFEVAMRYAWPKQALELYRSKPTAGPSPEFPTGRSGALMQLAYFACEMGMTNAEVYSIIRNADDRWGKFKDRTDRDRRLLDIISVARIKYPVEDLTLADTFSPLTVMGFEDVLNTEIKLEWTIEGLLQLAGSMIMTGLPGVGKTQLSLRFLMALALGQDYLGFKITRPHKLIFFSLEMGLADLKYFLDIMKEDLTEAEQHLLQENLKFIPYGEALYLDKEPIQKKVEELIKEHNPDGVIYDSMGSTTADELSSETVVKAITDWDARIRKHNNVFSWFIHHQRKAQAQNKKPKSLSDLYGNQYIAARATSVYCLWSEGGALEFLCLKKRLARMDEPIGIERTSSLNFIRGLQDMQGFETFDIPPSDTSDEEVVEPKVLPSTKKEGGLLDL